MARQLDYLVTLDDPASKTYQAFATREYWEDLVKLHAESTLTELTQFSVDADGIHVTFTHTLTKDQLPPIIAALVPLKLTIAREQHFDRFNEATDSAQGSYVANLPGGALDLRGTYELKNTESGSALESKSTCKVKIPLVGGKIEEVLLKGLRDLFDTERDFTRTWISSHS